MENSALFVLPYNDETKTFIKVLRSVLRKKNLYISVRGRNNDRKSLIPKIIERNKNYAVKAGYSLEELEKRNINWEHIAKDRLQRSILLEDSKTVCIYLQKKSAYGRRYTVTDVTDLSMVA
jgi:hypothetical protein